MRRAPEVASDILQGNLLNLKQKFGTVLEEDTAYLREPLSTFAVLNKNLKEEEL